MPFALKDAVGQELDRLEKYGVIKKVDSSEWAAPIVTVPKAEGKIHLCGDYMQSSYLSNTSLKSAAKSPLSLRPCFPDFQALGLQLSHLST